MRSGGSAIALFGCHILCSQVGLRSVLQGKLAKMYVSMASGALGILTPYKTGALVWLEGVNLCTHYPTSKLAPK